MRYTGKAFSEIDQRTNSQSGNAMVYVLIIVALFAAINFIISRQTDTSETNVVDEQKIDFYATQILNYAAQARESVERMTITGTEIDDLTFFLPEDADFDTEVTYAHVDKVYHQLGGGLTEITLPPELAAPPGGTESTPAAGWYLGRFNNVEWTDSAANDVILVAYRIPQAVCERINEMIAGSAYIPPPQLTGHIRTYLIDNTNTVPAHEQSNAEGHSGGTGDFTTTECAACDGVPSLCVQNNGGDVFAYYDIIAQQ